MSPTPRHEDGPNREIPVPCPPQSHQPTFVLQAAVEKHQGMKITPAWGELQLTTTGIDPTYLHSDRRRSLRTMARNLDTT
jgi:hypothetical protein